MSIAKKSGKKSKSAKKVTPSKSKSVKPAKSKALKSKKKKKKIAEEEEQLRKKSKKVKHVEEDDDEILDDSEDDTEIDDDDEIDNSAADDDDSDSDGESVDFDSLDAGPSAETVPFGCNCASCRFFVKWDDKIRDSAEWMEKMEKTKKRCPKLFGPEEYESDNPQELVAQADDPACAKFDLNEKKAPAHFVETLDTVKSTFNIPEFDVLVLLSDKLRAAKNLERSMGYRFGQTVTIQIEGKDVKCRVVDFVKKKGREVILRGELNGRTIKASIPAVRVEIDE